MTRSLYVNFDSGEMLISPDEVRHIESDPVLCDFEWTRVVWGRDEGWLHGDWDVQGPETGAVFKKGEAIPLDVRNEGHHPGRFQAVGMGKAA